MRKIFGFDFLEIEDPIVLKNMIVEKGLFSYDDMEEYKSVSQIVDFVYKKKIRENLYDLTIMYNYPAMLMPLARRNDNDNRIIDPMVQREAFEEQLKAKEQGDDETMEVDESFLMSMEQGMPPISGLGFGIDRLMMLIYNRDSIRDVVLFPLMKPEE